MLTLSCYTGKLHKICVHIALCVGYCTFVNIVGILGNLELLTKMASLCCVASWLSYVRQSPYSAAKDQYHHN